ncbi:MAG: S-layer homology domain-containing protein [Clostridia bacterium]|jgi:hypothetical protein
MRLKITTFILTLSLVFGGFPIVPSAAAYIPPSVFGAPKNVGVIFDAPDLTAEPENWNFRIGYSASAEIRAILEAEDSKAFTNAGYDSLNITVQVDYKIDDGAWRFTKPNYMDWAAINYPYFNVSTGTWTGSLVFDPVDLIESFPNKTFTGGKAYFNTHSISFRIRYWVDYWETGVDRNFKHYSPWSSVFKFSNSEPVFDATNLLNYEPKILAVVLKKNVDGKTYIDFGTDRINDNTQLLHNISNKSVTTDVWIMIQEGSWIDVGKFKYLRENFTVDVSNYFTSTELTGDEKYEVRIRYAFDYKNYPAAGKTGNVYSPFSSIISNGIPIYKGASAWAINDLNLAQGYGLITNRILDNISKKATREEFAEIIVKLYEKSKGETIVLGTATFKDTTNTEILKAATVGLMNGVGKGNFAPKAYITREQMAVTILRVLKVLNPSADYSTVGVKKFVDDKYIEKWAKEGVYFCSKVQIVNGIGRNKFNPDGAATREMSVIVDKRAYEYLVK